MLDLFTSPSTRTRLLGAYRTWKAVSETLRKRGEHTLSLKIERALVGRYDSLGVFIDFTPEDVVLVYDAAGIR